MTAVATPAIWLAASIADLPTPFDDDGRIDLAALASGSGGPGNLSA
jgi:hypothetical protein